MFAAGDVMMSTAMPRCPKTPSTTTGTAARQIHIRDVVNAERDTMNPMTRNKASSPPIPIFRLDLISSPSCAWRS